jgi:tetratricopeptide (TPR) repeat protein
MRGITDAKERRPTLPEPKSFHMTPEEFRQRGRAAIDWIADYMERVEKLPVLSQARPGQVYDALPAHAPEQGEAFEAVMRDLDEIVMPGITHWQSPSFFAYFPANASGPAMLGDLLRNQGRVKEAIEQQRHALELDPLSPVTHGVLGISLAAAHQFEEGRARFEHTLASGGDQAAALAFLFLSGPLFGLTGDEMADHGVELARLLGAEEPEIAASIGHAFASDGSDEELLSEAREAADRLVADSVFTVRQIAVLYTRLGDEETALQWIEKAAVDLDLSLALVATDPSLDPLRDDPRMQRLMDELGLPNGYNPAADDYDPSVGDSRAGGLR